MWVRRTVAPCFKTVSFLKRSGSPWTLFASRSCSEIPKKKGKLAPLQERKMVDRFRLWAKGGEGGSGCSSFRRSRNDRRGKPDGGNGGRGGDVILECSTAVWDFSNLQHHLNAKRGGHGVSKGKVGSRGADKVAHVPVGTVIHLVRGALPSAVENNSVAGLDPWEVPGSVETNLNKSDQNVLTTEEEELDLLEKLDIYTLPFSTEKVIEKTASTQFTIPDASPEPMDQSSHCELESGFLRETSSCSEEGESKAEEIQSECEEMSEVEPEEEIIQHSVAELLVRGQQVLVATGGEGGLGSTSMGKVSKSHKYSASDLEISGDATSGLPGSEAVLILELKSIADVGLVGMPNAGKSTLLGAISRAKPSIGHYAFTTLRPNIGNLNYDDYFSVSVADIPGLIKGAHGNRGLGHAFLRHVERTKVLAYVVDLSAALDGRKGIPPWEQLRDLVSELECHQPGLSDRPSLIVANKIDEEGAADVYEELKRRVSSVPIFPVCAILEEGIPELKAGLRKLVDGVEKQRLELSRIVLD